MNAIDIRIEKERDSESARVHTKLGTVYNHGRNKGGTIKRLEDFALNAIREKYEISDKSKILLVGCGTGRIIDELAKCDHTLVCIDLDFAELNVAKKRLSDRFTWLMNASADHIPFKSAIFDLSICLLPQFLNSDLAIAEMKRVTKKKGIVISENRYQKKS